MLLAITSIPSRPPKVGGVRDHYLGARLGKGVRFELDLDRTLTKRPRTPELGVTAIDALERPVRTRPVDFRIEAPEANAGVGSRWFHASILRRTISTFSWDIAYSRHETLPVPKGQAAQGSQRGYAVR